MTEKLATVEMAAILAGGLATRLRPITEKIPKSLVEVGGKPFIDWQLALLHRQGLRRVVLCLGYLGEQIEQYVGNGAGWGLEVSYSYDGAQLVGTGGALVQARPYLDEDFWVLYGDSYLDFDYAAVSRYYRSQTALGLMTVFHNLNQWDTSNVIFEDERLLKYHKFNRTPAMQYIDYGAAILNRTALDRLPAAGQPSDLATLYNGLVADGLMVGYEVCQHPKTDEAVNQFMTDFKQWMS